MLRERMEDLLARSRRSDCVTATVFLDPASLHMAQNLCKHFCAKHAVVGGFVAAERNIVALLPDYMDLIDFDPETLVGAVRIQPVRAKGLSHRDYLGSILALGLKRDAVGDICVRETDAIAIVTLTAARLLLSELTSVARQAVHTEAVPLRELQTPSVSDSNTLVFTVQSIRMDTILAGALRLSRAQVCALIDSAKVQRNWSACIDHSARLREQDVLSVRGFGRIKLVAIQGKSKKGKTYVTVEVFAT